MADTSWRTLRAEVEIPMRIGWEDKVCVEVSSDGDMSVYDVRGVLMGCKEMKIHFMAFGNAKNNGPRLTHVYRDEAWIRDRDVLAGCGLDRSVMAEPFTKELEINLCKIDVQKIQQQLKCVSYVLVVSRFLNDVEIEEPRR
ncbi:hypothetical protein TSTA_098840 [Talaromyces stipitatus ATCC 10500]|uniref:Uncharacterized protein n=1 Tax=Talaromyces stipitatus (strain ATCC 10500 / CBS 375.48 / QM 6759 / NRRL 1006) TaxID=441959 RepID=B8MLQ6_TALSN|nr:uncharacterized protein TSTA_098840 [Talaromyces stipitatus ATCC 10500]EED13628.1 hypothetical protein TSTA_098840 [Talaromyces stipitatus ATCC 10500]